jgi:TniQ
MRSNGDCRPSRGVLVRTPHPHPTESLFGYVIRLTEANGYSSPMTLWNLARIPRGLQLSAGFPANRLAPLVGVAPDALAQLAYRVAEPADFGLSNIGRGPLKILGHILGNNASRQAGYLRLKACAFCPQCVEETGYIDAFWNLFAAVACPTHGRLGLSRCPACQRDIGWRRARLNRCSCGYHFPTVKCEEAPDPVLHLMKLIRTALHGTRLEGPTGMAAEFLSSLPLSALISLIDRLGYLLTVDQAKRTADLMNDRKQKGNWQLTPQTSVADRVTAYAEVSRALSNWPRGFHAALDALNLREPGSAEGTKYCQSRDLLYRHLLTGKAVSRYLPFLRTEYFRHWSWPDRAPEPQHFSTASFGEQDSIPPTRAEKFRSDGPVGPIIATGKVARLVGLPISVLEVLRDEGIYRASDGRGGAYNWYQDDISEFTKKLHAIFKGGTVRSKKYNCQTVTVKQAMSLKLRSARAKADIIVALLDGRLRAIGTSSTAIGAVKMEREQLETFLLRKRIALRGDTCSIPECAKMCGIDAAAIRDALDQGLLQGVQTQHRMRISGQSVRVFQERFVALSELAREHRSSSRALQTACERLDREVICLRRGRSAAIQPLVRREYVPEILREAKEEAVRRERRSFAHRREAWQRRLHAYLSRLDAKKQRLPRMNGRPDKSRIARACGFDRNLLYKRTELISMIAEVDEREKGIDGFAGVLPADRMRIYLRGLADRRERIPLWGGGPNLKLLAERCGVNRIVFYRHSELLRMANSIAKRATI